MTLKLTIAASLTALTLLATGSALAAPGVATGAVNIREDAGTQFDIIGSLKKGEFVDIIECDAGWSLPATWLSSILTTKTKMMRTTVTTTTTTMST